MITKNNLYLQFKKKRNFQLVTPCCNKPNKDGKFINYIGYPEIYGFCHSCGKTSFPPTLYSDEKGNQYMWDETKQKFVKKYIAFTKPLTNDFEEKLINQIQQKFIPEEEIWKNFEVTTENNLLQYLRKNYPKHLVDDAKEVYALSTYVDGGTMFWNINKELKVQKLKIVYYCENGRRKNYFKVPYKNEDGYYSCLFGEHLLIYNCNQNKKVVLVESEKTAIIGHMLLPKFVWLAYGGLNGLTLSKAIALKGFTSILIPDLSEKAVEVAAKKVFELKQNGLNVKLWDMTNGMSDEELKEQGIFNHDLEDVFRNILHSNENKKL